jgi:hypothetical protein
LRARNIIVTSAMIKTPTAARVKSHNANRGTTKDELLSSI